MSCRYHVSAKSIARVWPLESAQPGRHACTPHLQEGSGVWPAKDVAKQRERVVVIDCSIQPARFVRLRGSICAGREGARGACAVRLTHGLVRGHGSAGEGQHDLDGDAHQPKVHPAQQHVSSHACLVW